MKAHPHPRQINRNSYSKLLRAIENGNCQDASMFLDNYATYLGWGCTRKAYLINLEGYEPFVLKIEWQPEKYNYIAQNRKEVRTWLNNDHKFLPDIYDWDTKNRLTKWIEVEYIHPTKGMPLNKEINAIIKKLNLYGDVYENRHWGKNSRGHYKLIDFGISKNQF